MCVCVTMIVIEEIKDLRHGYRGHKRSLMWKRGRGENDVNIIFMYKILNKIK